ncbi:flagellar biosynthetic protein FliR [Velocimicrobium porci]|uniref:Flagellar biosynthetic protein FliR n=1 Tax=Velocimicrobium porci TaxID=2606634 RepID=A0A6L5XWT2_9FIRM|nr:flagellar biosynthetic protein FliR [Velocimicrobium porci]MSS62997.1 flagellar type III secretion system protein FliR [Velocimicrobium porci]
MSFTVENVEFYMLVIVRISAFLAVAPFYSITNVPRKLKVGLATFLGIMMISMIDYTPLKYNGVIGYGLLVVKDAIVGLVLGYMASICTYILNFAGQLIDMEIGFSMAQVLDPTTRLQTTVTGNYYSYMVMLLMMVTNMHYYILSAILDSFRLVPVGDVVLKGSLYEIMGQFMSDYFVIGFRIVLPIFAATLVINVVLGILARVAPQMNMFVIGMQLKIFAGLIILFLMVDMLPQVADFIFKEMKNMMSIMMAALASS